jgi:hypothetical protein
LKVLGKLNRGFLKPSAVLKVEKFAGFFPISLVKRALPNDSIEVVEPWLFHPVSGPYDLQKNIPLLIDNEGLGYSSEAIKPVYLFIGIEQDGKHQAICGNEGLHPIRSFGIDTHRKHLEISPFEPLIEGFHRRHFLTTGGTPGGPEVQENHLTPVIG